MKKGILVRFKACQRASILIVLGLMFYGEAALAADITISSVTSTSTNFPDQITLGNDVIVKVNNLHDFIQTNDGASQKVIFYLNNIPVTDIKGIPDFANNAMDFDLELNDANQAVWSRLLGNATLRAKPVTVSIGLPGREPLIADPANGNQVKLVVIPTNGLALVYVIGIIVITGLTLWLAARTDIIRDNSPKPKKNWRLPFSLAKTQMAFWFVLVTTSYLFLYLLTHSFNVINSTALILIGLGAATALGAEVQNASKENTPKSPTLDKINELLEKRSALNPVNPDGTKNPAYDDLTKQLETITPKSAGFLNDVLTDDKGVSLHRFQLFIWTCILGIIFLVEVYQNVGMPTFPTQLLALMGISSGTYLGFMIPEQHSTEQSQIKST